MSWIKRNLYFVIGSVVALVLLGVAGYYTYTGWQNNAAVVEDLNKAYDELASLYNQTPNPGDGVKVNNIKAAQDYLEQVHVVASKTRKFFERISPIPDSPRVSGQEFSTTLPRTVEKMQRDAANASVALPQKSYKFSFEQQIQKLNIGGDAGPLAVQLGEVKAICDVLFRARINSLDGLRRERVAPDDQTGPQTDYLDDHSVTNQLAVIAPYEITFRCFSPELAAVLSGFASSPAALLVRTIDVEPAPAVAATTTSTTQMPTAPAPTPAAKSSADTPPGPGWWFNPYSRQWTPPGRPPPGAGTAETTPVVPPPRPAQPTAAPATPGGPQPAIEEKPLKVTMLIHVAKLLPQK